MSPENHASSATKSESSSSVGNLCRRAARLTRNLPAMSRPEEALDGARFDQTAWKIHHVAVLSLFPSLLYGISMVFQDFSWYFHVFPVSFVPQVVDSSIWLILASVSLPRQVLTCADC